MLDELGEIARQHNQSTAAIALAWLLANPLVTAPIVGANTVDQLQPSLGALEVTLSEEEIIRLNELSSWQ